MPLFKKHGLQDPDLADTQAGIATQAMLGRARLGSVTSGELLILRETQCVLCKHFRGGTSVVVIPTRKVVRMRWQSHGKVPGTTRALGKGQFPAAACPPVLPTSAWGLQRKLLTSCSDPGALELSSWHR